MTPSLPNSTISQRPLDYFIEETEKLKNTQADVRLYELQPLVLAAFKSLLVLQESADQLPDLSNGRWFLQSHFLSARARAYKEIEIAKKSMLTLSVKANQRNDPFGILPFTASFFKFANRAIASPTVFQQPYEIEVRLCVPDPQPVSLNHCLTDNPLDSDFLPL